ncbi:MAG: hypothetical protein AAFX40_11750 [Cyanobacteria bacterium J06639_1]
MTSSKTRVAALFADRQLADRAIHVLQARGISHRNISELSSELELEVAQLEGINIVGEMAPAAIAAIESLRHLHPIVDWQAVFRSLGLPARMAALYCGHLRKGHWMIVARVSNASVPLNQLMLELLGGRHAIAFSPECAAPAAWRTLAG